MATEYKSKYKGEEIDDGVALAKQAATLYAATLHSHTPKEIKATVSDKGKLLAISDDGTGKLVAFAELMSGVEIIAPTI